MHTSIVELLPNLAVVVVEWLEVLVDVGDGAGEAQVERPKDPDIPREQQKGRIINLSVECLQDAARASIGERKLLVVLVLDELDDDVLVGLDLEHLEGEAEEGGRPAVAAMGAAGVVELHGLVDEGLRREAEALPLPVVGLVDLGPHDLLYQVLRVRAVDAPSHGVRAVRHCSGLSVDRRRRRPRRRLRHSADGSGVRIGTGGIGVCGQNPRID